MTSLPLFRSFGSVPEVTAVVDKLKDFSFSLTSTFTKPFSSEPFRVSFCENGGLAVLLDYYDHSTGDNQIMAFITLALFFMDSQKVVLQLIEHGLLTKLFQALYLPNFSMSAIVALVNISYELYETKFAKDFCSKTIPVLNDLVKSHQLPETYKYIPKIIINLAADKNCYQDLIKLPTFDILNQLLVDGNPAVVLAAITSISKIVKKDDAKIVDQYVEIAPFGTIISLLSSKDSNIASYATLLLRNLISTNKTAVEKLDALGFTKQIIENTKAYDINAQLYNTVTLANMCGPSYAEVRQSLVQKGAISQLLSLCNSKYPKTQEAAIMGISNLSTDSDQVRCQILDSDLVKAIEHVFTSNNEKSFDYATFTIARLYFGSPNMLELLKSYKVTPLMALLNTSEIDEVKHNLILMRSLICLSCIASTNLENPQKDYIIESGMIDRALELYQNGTDKVRESAASLLGSLAKDNYLIKQLLDMNIIPPIILGLTSKKSQLSQLSLLLLYNLCQDIDSVLSIGEQGVLKPVVDLLTGSSPGLAMKTLVALSFAHPNCEVILETNALDTIVKFMTSEVDELSKVAISTSFLFKNHKIYKDAIHKLFTDKELQLLKEFEEKGVNPIL